MAVLLLLSAATLPWCERLKIIKYVRMVGKKKVDRKAAFSYDWLDRFLDSRIFETCSGLGLRSSEHGINIPHPKPELQQKGESSIANRVDKPTPGLYFRRQGIDGRERMGIERLIAGGEGIGGEGKSHHVEEEVEWDGQYVVSCEEPSNVLEALSYSRLDLTQSTELDKDAYELEQGSTGEDFDWERG
ncbi:hypothetical protein U1Q18_009273 [Sarracenia purpurea var. burkii]